MTWCVPKPHLRVYVYAHMCVYVRVRMRMRMRVSVCLSVGLSVCSSVVNNAQLSTERDLLAQARARKGGRGGGELQPAPSTPEQSEEK